MELQQQGQVEGGAAAVKCPRCDSSNTKFCYYNNYSLSQPRHLCKSCKRYWTRGGTLRKVPVGGASKSRKNNNKSTTTTTKSSSSSAFLAPLKSSLAKPIGIMNINPPPTPYYYEYDRGGSGLGFSAAAAIATCSSSRYNPQQENLGLKEDNIMHQTLIPYGGFLGLDDELQILLQRNDFKMEEGHGNTLDTDPLFM